MALDLDYDDDYDDSYDYNMSFEPPAPAPTNHNQEYYSYGFTPIVQAPSPPFPGATYPPQRQRHRDRVGRLSGMAFTADEEVEYGCGRRSRELLSPVPSRTAAARFNFDKSWSDLARLLM